MKPTKPASIKPARKLKSIADFRPPRVPMPTPYEGDDFPDSDITKLHTRFLLYAYEFEQKLSLLHARQTLRYQWRIAEGWRSPSRQFLLYGAGLSIHQPWNSAHQYGLAIDIVPVDADPDWAQTIDRTELQQLVFCAQPFDLIAPEDEHVGHFCHPAWPEWQKWMRYPDYLHDLEDLAVRQARMQSDTPSIWTPGASSASRR